MRNLDLHAWLEKVKYLWTISLSNYKNWATSYSKSQNTTEMGSETVQ